MLGRLSHRNLEMKKQNKISVGRIGKIGFLAIFFLAACSAPVADQQASNLEQTSMVTIYKSATCGCCSKWSEYLEENGFAVLVEEVQDFAAVKDQYEVPLQLRSCHTAILDGYVIEGHVPVSEIERLLDERPNVIGIAVPGMPPGSPGMEVEGLEFGTFDVIAFDWSGNTEVFASYP